MERPEKQRTIPQNSSMHKWCELVADELNRHGITQKIFFEALNGMDCANSKHSVKDAFRNILSEISGKESTADGETDQYHVVYQALSKAVGESLGIVLPAWPDRFNHGKE